MFFEKSIRLLIYHCEAFGWIICFPLDYYNKMIAERDAITLFCLSDVDVEVKIMIFLKSCNSNYS